MLPNEVQAIIAALDEHFGERFDKQDEALKAVQDEQRRTRSELRQMSAIYPKLETLASKSDEILEIVSSREDKQAFGREVRRRLGWNKGTGTLVKLVFTGFAMAGTAVAVVHWTATPEPTIPPSIPAVHITTPTAVPSKVSP